MKNRLPLLLSVLIMLFAIVLSIQKCNEEKFNNSFKTNKPTLTKPVVLPELAQNQIGKKKRLSKASSSLAMPDYSFKGKKVDDHEDIDEETAAAFDPGE